MSESTHEPEDRRDEQSANNASIHDADSGNKSTDNNANNGNNSENNASASHVSSSLRRVMAQPAKVASVIAQNRSDRRFILMLVAMCVLLVIGVSLIVYPTFADAWNKRVSSRAVAGYVEQVADTSQEIRDKQLAIAKAYNESLVNESNMRFAPSIQQTAEYNKILDVTGTGIMGYITIPKIETRLPIYHGTDDTVLQIAAGHFEGSSLPVGGESTHTVVTGHTGLPSAMLFTGIDRLEKGDTFAITVYNEVLTYEVDKISVVLPDNVDELAIEPGRDLASLVTCTPYGVNSHRLIVTGHRIPTPESEKTKPYQDTALRRDVLITVLIIGATIAAISAVFIVQGRRIRKRRQAAAGMKAEDQHSKQ